MIYLYNYLYTSQAYPFQTYTSFLFSLMYMLSPYVARASTVHELIMWRKRDGVLHKDGFLAPVPY